MDTVTVVVWWSPMSLSASAPNQGLEPTPSSVRSFVLLLYSLFPPPSRDTHGPTSNSNFGLAVDSRLRMEVDCA